MRGKFVDQIFCTLFDANYLDKGIVLYDSMVECIEDFKLYVFAFDDKCYEILSDMGLEKMIVISLKDFESEKLLRVKRKRTKAEYCWTCTAWTIKYVLDVFKENICTYIDADMMFFSSPKQVFDDMRLNGCSIIIVPHRFKSDEEEKKAYNTVGAYCVEFNTFVNNAEGRKALDWWADKCLEWCFYAVPGTTKWYGDQKYLNVFPDKFEGVYICNHVGVGLAPWNNMLVEYAGEKPLRIKDKLDKKIYPLILYHFENVSFLTKHLLHVSSGLKSKQLREQIYDVYVARILEKRKIIEKEYGFKLSKKRRIVTQNVAMKIYQKYIGPFRRVKSVADLYWVKDE